MKKIIVILILMSFIYQDVTFCLPERNFNLRPRMAFDEPPEEPVKPVSLTKEEAMLFIHEYRNIASIVSGDYLLLKDKNMFNEKQVEVIEPNRAVLRKSRDVFEPFGQGTRITEAHLTSLGEFIQEATEAVAKIDSLLKEGDMVDENFSERVEMLYELLLQSGSSELRKSEFLLSEAIRRTVPLVRLNTGEELTQREDIKITFYSDPRIETIYADRFKLRRVVLNLLKNAGEAMPEGGELEIKANLTKGPKVLIAILDTGIGIPAEELEKVFEPYYSTKGTMGVGLAICREIIEKHGGSISVENNSKKGSTFTISLPVEGRLLRDMMQNLQEVAGEIEAAIKESDILKLIDELEGWNSRKGDGSIEEAKRLIAQIKLIKTKELPIAFFEELRRKKGRYYSGSADKYLSGFSDPGIYYDLEDKWVGAFGASLDELMLDVGEFLRRIGIYRDLLRDIKVPDESVLDKSKNMKENRGEPEDTYQFLAYYYSRVIRPFTSLSERLSQEPRTSP